MRGRDTDRRTLLRFFGLVTATTVPGCSAIDSEENSASTVNQDLRSTPTPRDRFDTAVTSDGTRRLSLTASRLVGWEERHDTEQVTAYDPKRLERIRTVHSDGRLVVGPEGAVVEHRPDETAVYTLSETDPQWRARRQLRTLRFERRRFPLLYDESDSSGGTVLRLDTDSWTVDWEQSVGQPVSVSHDHLLCHDGDELVCRDIDTGTVRWRTTLPDPLEPSLDTTSRRVGDAVVVVDSRRVDVLAADTGTHRGRYTPDRPLEPRRTVGTETGVVCGGPDATMVGVDAAAGDVQWRVDEFATTPVAAGSVVRATGFDGDRTTAGVDPRDGGIEWERRGAPVAVADGDSYVLDGETLAVVTPTGTVRWRRHHQFSSVTTPTFGGPGGSIAGPPVSVRGDRVLLWTPEGLVVWSVSDGGERLRFGGATVESAVLGRDGRLFVATGERIGAVDL